MRNISLGDPFERFISEQIKAGRYGNASDVIHASLRLLEAHEHRRESLRRALIEGEGSGDVAPLDMKELKRAACRKAGLHA